MTLPDFRYVAPGTLAEVVSALTGPDSKPLAGGHGVLNAIRRGRSRPQLLVDLAGLDELHGCAPTDAGGVRIGALTTLTELVEDTGLTGRWPALVAAGRVGDPQIRNRGTVGGCVATLRTPVDLAAALLAEEATIVIAGPAGGRRVRADEYFAADRSALDPGEIVTGVELPPARADRPGGYQRIADPATLEPICGMAARFSRTPSGVLDQVRLAVVGAARRPVRVRAAEGALEGVAPPVDPAAVPVGPVRAYLDDDRASAAYRAHLTAVLAARLVNRLFQDDGGASR